MNTPNPFPSYNNSNVSKAGNKGTMVAFVLDESGSMSSFRSDTIGGVNSFVDSQKKDKDDTFISVTTFEGGRIKEVYNRVHVNSFPIFSEKDYSPLGNTNLLDAIGNTINRINRELSNIPENERPSIIVQVMTDGHENSSREYDRSKIKSLVEECQKNDWIFTFVGANIDSVTTSTSLGFNAAGASNYSTSNTTETFQVMADSVTRMKSMRSMGLSNHDIYATGAIYSADEKARMEKK